MYLMCVCQVEMTLFFTNLRPSNTNLTWAYGTRRWRRLVFHALLPSYPPFPPYCWGLDAQGCTYLGDDIRNPVLGEVFCSGAQKVAILFKILWRSQHWTAVAHPSPAGEWLYCKLQILAGENPFTCPQSCWHVGVPVGPFPLTVLAFSEPSLELLR